MTLTDPAKLIDPAKHVFYPRSCLTNLGKHPTHR